MVDLPLPAFVDLGGGAEANDREMGMETTVRLRASKSLKGPTSRS